MINADRFELNLSRLQQKKAKNYRTVKKKITHIRSQVIFLLFCILLHNNQNYVVFFGNFKQALN